MDRQGRAWRRVFAGAAVVIALAVTGSFAQTAPEPKKAEDVYKNIQALKGTPADQVVPAMQFISNALGVDCEFCHVRGGFEKDDVKAKGTARKMMGMMMAINKTNFDGHRDVTCFTCHRGSTEVAATPLIADVEPPHTEHDEEAKPPALPPAQQFLDKYVQALGGAEALAKVTSRVLTGSLSSAGQPPHAVEVFAKAPNKRASYVHLEQGDSVTAFDGTSGWLGNPGRPARDMSESEASAAAFDAEFRLATRLKDLFKEFQVAPAEKIGAHDVVVVTARSEGRPPVRLYFDTQSGLLVRLVRYVETPLGRNPTQIDYDDYREADGIKLPYRWTVARPLGRFTIQADNVKQNVAIDDAKFKKPAVEATKAEAPH